MVKTIEAMRMDWIDPILRQLVIIVGFLGATLATQRRKHINIDALSKLLPEGARKASMLAVDLLSLVACGALALAGGKLVALGREFPSELVGDVDEWHFQLMFPVGFGLLGLHFLVRVLEDAELIRTGTPLPGEGPMHKAEAAAGDKEVAP
jgi:TRAP-type C4-dicarboxylate transport system permease small subunit